MPDPFPQGRPPTTPRPSIRRAKPNGAPEWDVEHKRFEAELMGLVRGLLQAGAQSLMLSLWDVHDASTRDFMIAFYSRLVQGMSKPLAVQAAMAELRRSHPHPYYWAPFALIGKG